MKDSSVVCRNSRNIQPFLMKSEQSRETKGTEKGDFLFYA